MRRGEALKGWGDRDVRSGREGRALGCHQKGQSVIGTNEGGGVPPPRKGEEGLVGQVKTRS